MQQKRVVYAFYECQPDITISLTIYNKMEELARRDFYLRNLSGQTEAEQIEQAKKIMNEVAEEIHYLSGFGVDKGVIKLAGKKVDEMIYPNYRTDAHFFHYGAMFKTITRFWLLCHSERPEGAKNLHETFASFASNDSMEILHYYALRVLRFAPFRMTCE